jgi:hypothetical protein
MTNVSAFRPAIDTCKAALRRAFGRIWEREWLAAALIVAAVAAPAMTSLIQSREQATAQSGLLARPAPLTVAASGSSRSGELGPFAFGHVEFDWGPSAAGGVPGFDSWPTGSRR